MGERTEARRSIEAARARMSVIADELARRSSPEYVKSRAREAAMIKASNVRDRAASNPGALAALGALAGGGASFALAKLAKRRRGARPYEGGFRTEGAWVAREYVEQPSWRAEDVGRATYSAEPGYTPRPGADYASAPEVSTVGAESWSEPYQPGGASEISWRRTSYEEEEQPSRGAQIKAKAQEKAADLKSRAGELSHRVSDRTGSLRHKVSDRTGDLRHKVSDKTGELRHRFQERRESGGPGLRERMPSAEELRSQARQRPLPVILGGVLLGSLAATLLPLTRRERKVMHPAKEKARHQIGDQFSSFEHRMEEKLSGGGEEERESAPRREERGEERGEERRREPASGPAERSGSSGGGAYATATSETASREELGLRSGQANEPYRQPSVAEQLERQNKDKGTVH